MTDSNSPVPYGDDASADFDHEDSNRSSNRHFNDILTTQLKRRQLLKGGLGLAVAGGLFAHAGWLGAAPPHASGKPGLGHGFPGKPGRPIELGFTAIAASRVDDIVVPPEYTFDVILPWGTPILGDYPAYLDGGHNSGVDQEQQIGMHHDGMHYFPLSPSPVHGSRHGLLVMNHEYIDQRAMHASGPTLVDGVRDADEVRKEIAAHGVSVVEIREHRGRWEVVRGRFNRRVTAATPMEIRGPARSHVKMRTAYSPDGTRTRGTHNNCAHGFTPWGTYLTCEENFAGYYVNRGERPREHGRYGVATGNGRYRWETVEPRYDATPGIGEATSDFRNEPNTQGWITEINPFRPGSTPVKHTAMGRFAHEGIVFAKPGPGRPLVAYMGDDAQNEYIYKYVSRENYIPGRAGSHLLDDGTLYAARFNDDGHGEWLPLDIDDAGFRAAADAAGVAFSDQGDVVINARLAADVAGATPMDRPEWGAVDPNNGWVYFTLTNNSQRGNSSEVDEANPRGPNPYGHIIRFLEDGGRHDSATFTWDIFLLSGTESDSLGPDGNPLTADNIHASPDGLWFDANGLLWIQTDMSGSQLASGPFGNNQMLVANPATGQIKRFLSGPNVCEVTGVVATPDHRTLFVNIQHPGEGGGGSSWPGNVLRPRSATVVVRRRDGGIVGT
ncbi:PhoX family protein [Marilutibacter alkalisoli]|uniref:PhoX family phosphatase n=1 Tax=Marilutibacter alkalisoli TaxID=2591633 RepID=A0A514BS42_9GAMM|nr:PhoX family phosphatase [Lysobacter alkalisoli]QDH70135.1 PhoX family phosphatase [Lysobacter alkalisoli]